jgi:hypothetical protein
VAGHGGRRRLMVVAVFGAVGCGLCTGVGVVTILVELPSPFPLRHGVVLS